MKQQRIFIILIFLCLLTSCVESETTGAPDEAQELPEEAQQYIELAHEDLAARLGVDPEQIELDMISELAEVDDAYIIRLVVNETTYEYHGQNGEVMLVSEPLPTAEP